MAKMIALFFVALLGIYLRWVVTGEFDPSQFKLVSIFLIVAPILPLISMRMKRRDTDYAPTDSIGDWTTSLRDKWLTGEKKLYKGEQLVATYHRIYKKRYHKIIADLIEEAGLWFLQLEFQFKNGRTFTVTSEENWKGNARYTIWENNKKIAEIRSDYKFENIKKLLEQTYLEIDGHVYEFHDKTIRSGIKLLKDGEIIAEVERDIKGLHSLNFNSYEIKEEHQALLLMNWIIFTYRYNK